jgi:uncharacterized membrane protein (UPF0182 family)
MTKPTVPQPNTVSARVGQTLPLRPTTHGDAEKQRHPWRGKLLRWIMPVAAVLLVVLLAIPDLLQKWLWMRQLTYAGIFWTLLSVKWGMTSIAFIGAFLFLWINLRLAARYSFALVEYDPANSFGSLETNHIVEIRGIPISRRVVARAMAFITAAVSLLFALVLYGQWDTYLRFRYGESFGFEDPIFKRDVGFYVFRLPFAPTEQPDLPDSARAPRCRRRIRIRRV